MKKIIFPLLIIFSILNCRLFHLYEDDFATADDSTTTVNLTDTTTTTVGPVIAYDVFYKDLITGSRIDLTNDSTVDFGINSLLSLKLLNINVVNTGTVDLDFNINAALSDNTSDFKIIQQPPPLLIPGATGTISVEFRYSEKGVKLAGIDINNSDNSVRYITLNLSGECNGDGPIFVSSYTGDDSSGDGSMKKPYKTINLAVNRAVETSNRYGVSVSAGVYEESIGINTKVILKGGYSVINGIPDYFNSKPTDRENPVYKTEIRSGGDFVIMINGETSIIDRTMTIDGFVISNTGGLTNSCGIYITGASPTISVCTINGGGIGSESSTSILVDNSSDPLLKDSVVNINADSKAVWNSGIKVTGGSKCSITNNDIDLGSAFNPKSYLAGIWLDNAEASIQTCRIAAKTSTIAEDVTSCGIALENVTGKVEILYSSIYGGFTSLTTGYSFGVVARNSPGYITVMKSSIDGGLGAYSSGIAIYNCANYDISYNGENNFIQGGPGAINSTGISIYNSNGLGKITNNKIFGDLNAKNSVAVRLNNANPILENNYIQMNDGWNEISVGVSIENSYNKTIISNGNFIEGGMAAFSAGVFVDRSLVEIMNNFKILGGSSNSSENSITAGIYLNSALAGSVIGNNLIFGGSNGSVNSGVYVTGSETNIVITRNEICGGTADSSDNVGVFINTYSDLTNQTGKSALLSNNVIIGAKSEFLITNACALLTGGDSKPRVYNNNLISSISLNGDNTGDAMVGIMLKDQSSPDIVNNLIFNVGKGASCGIFEATSDATPAVLKNNNIFALTALYRDSTNVYISNIADVNDISKILQGTNGITMNNISIDMLNMSYFYHDINDWNLTSCTPTEITAGGFDLSTFITTDKLGIITRTVPFTIGAFELDNQ